MASTPRNGYTYGLSSGVDVELVELTPSEFLNAAREAGPEPVGGLRAGKVMRAALRTALRKVGETATTYVMLDAAGFKRLVPRTRDVHALEGVCAQIHNPTEAEMLSVLASLACTSGDGPESWTCVLPGDKPRAVVFEEIEPVTVEDALREASLSAKSEAAQLFQAIISGCARSIRSVDGVPVTRESLKGKGWDAYFGVRDTCLLGSVYDEIHGTGGEALGEVRLVRH